MNWIRLLAVALSGWAFYLTMRYNLHMFQLNGYKRTEQLHWLKKNLRQQWLLPFAFCLAILECIFPCMGLEIAECLILILMIIVYRAFARMHTKKKLVYTARVKRLVATDVVLSLLVFAGIGAGLGWKRLAGTGMLLAAAQLLLPLLCNSVNHSMEAGINRHYISDAKRKLKEVPGLKVIGVTGSYGKTSMKFYLQTLLQERFSVLVTPESFNTPMGVVKTIRGFLKPSHEIFICEMGARHVGDIKELCDIVHPECGIITSIGPQHLETFFCMENIQKTKFELADALPEGGMLFLNGDNSHIREKAAEYGRLDRIFYCTEAGEEAGKGYYAKDVAVSQLGTEFTMVSPEGEEERFQMRLIGAHNVINVAGAIAVANRLGIPFKQLKVPVRRIAPVEHRMQMREHGLVTIIDDAYNSNPVGSRAAVETLAMFEGIRILITPGMVELGEKEEEYNYLFGTYAADCCDYILLVGKKHTEPILKGALEKGFPAEKCLAYDKLEEALSYAYAIKGQGHKYILLENDLPDNY